MNREKIEECYKWDLSKIYSSINNIREDIKNVRNKLKEEENNNNKMIENIEYYLNHIILIKTSQ